MVKKTIPYGTKLPVYLTEKEIADVREHADPGFGFGILEGSRLRFDMSLDDIEELQGYVAAQANHTEDKKLQRRLDKVFQKLDRFLDEYDDQANL